MTDLRLFADHYIVHDDGTEEGAWSQEILGRTGVIYSYGQNHLAVLVQSAKAARELSARGFKLRQRGDTEAVFLFSPEQLHEVANVIQAKRHDTQPKAVGNLKED